MGLGNKRTILKRSAQPGLEEIFHNGQDVINHASSDPSTETYKLLHCYLAIGDNWTDKKLLRLFLIPSSIEFESIFAEIRDATENRVMSQIQALFNNLIKLGNLPEKTNVKTLSKIVFAIFSQEHLNCILNDDMDPIESFKQIKKQIVTLFEVYK